MAELMFHRNGYYEGVLLTFTHRNPKTGEVWSDDIGEWIPSDSVKWTKR